MRHRKKRKKKTKNKTKQAVGRPARLSKSVHTGKLKIFRALTVKERLEILIDGMGAFFNQSPTAVLLLLFFTPKKTRSSCLLCLLVDEILHVGDMLTVSLRLSFETKQNKTKRQEGTSSEVIAEKTAQTTASDRNDLATSSSLKKTSMWRELAWLRLMAFAAPLASSPTFFAQPFSAI